MKREVKIGGQAVLEGIMLRSPSLQAIAVRSPQGEIHTETIALSSTRRRKLWSFPVFRGMAALYDALSGAVGALQRSAQLLDPQEEISTQELGKAVALALGLAIGLFFVLPSLLMVPLSRYLGWGAVAVNLGEGLIRVLLFISYLLAVGKTPDIRTTFSYHGAEHKVIHCYEAGGEMTPQGVGAYSRFHRRCGTSFMLLVMVVGILLFSLFTPESILQRLVLRVLLLPILAGLTYEVVRFTSTRDNWLVRLITLPGLALQRLTTREPDSAQLEVALAALFCIVDPASLEGYNESV